MQETWVWSLGQESLLEKEMAPASVFLLEKSHEQRSLESYSPCSGKRVRCDWVTKQQKQDFGNMRSLLLIMFIYIFQINHVGLLWTVWISFIFFFNQEIMKDFLAKRDKGQLLIQRNRRLKENLLRPVIVNSNNVFKTLSN